MNTTTDTLLGMEDGRVPETRMESPETAQAFVQRLIQNDIQGGRVLKRAHVDGLVNGNPTLTFSRMLAAGRTDACRVNWGSARAQLEKTVGQFYDLQTQAPSIIDARTSHGTRRQRTDWSRILSANADRSLLESTTWDWEKQQSINSMVLHGCGPFFFEDQFAPIPRALQCNELKVPELARSTTEYWESCVLLEDYYAGEHLCIHQGRRFRP